MFDRYKRKLVLIDQMDLFSQDLSLKSPSDLIKDKATNLKSNRKKAPFFHVLHGKNACLGTNVNLYVSGLLNTNRKHILWDLTDLFEVCNPK